METIIAQIERLLLRYAKYYTTFVLKRAGYRNIEIARILKISPGRITRYTENLKFKIKPAEEINLPGITEKGE